MAVDDGLSYLENQISNRISDFKSSRTFYRRGSLIQTISAASLAAITTLLVGLNQIYHQNWLAALSLVSAGLTTVVAAWGSWFGFRNLWVSNQRTLNSLYELKSQMDYDKAITGAQPQEKVDSYYERYQTILNEANKTWGEARSPQQ
jgi:ABC-type nickel/cobalt efflux system permease component RcnA